MVQEERDFGLRHFRRVGDPEIGGDELVLDECLLFICKCHPRC